MYKWEDISKILPPMLSGVELKEKLLVLPQYDEKIREGSPTERLIALNDIYDVYYPSQMSVEIYCKIYLTILRSLQSKNNKYSVQQRNEIYKAIKTNSECRAIANGGDCFTILSPAGTGKSSAVNKAIEIIAKEEILEFEEPFCKVVPAICVSIPYNCSCKSLLLHILAAVDSKIGSCYYDRAVASKINTDNLILHANAILNNFVGLLVLDEMQNVIKHKAGMQLVGCLTQLLNSCGAICMVGTPDIAPFFESVDYLARRTVGLQYEKCEYNEYFAQFCQVLYHYQYTKNEGLISERIIRWLYDHSGGVLATVVAIIHDAQEISILSGYESLDLVVLQEAYEKRMKMLHGHITAQRTSNKGIYSKIKKEDSNGTMRNPEQSNNNTNINWSFGELIAFAKKEKKNVITLLKGVCSVTEIEL